MNPDRDKNDEVVTVKKTEWTDTNEQQKQRGIKQFEFENKNLKQLSGKSIVDRWFTIRDAIFSDAELNKQSLTALVNDFTPEIYPKKEDVGEIFLPAFYKLIDQSSEDLTKITEGEERSEKGLRLAELVYLFGVLIHQSADGNGQTYKTLALSYLRDNCPDFNNNYFPIKYTRENSIRNIMAWKDSLFDKVTVGYPPGFPSSDDVDIFSIFKKATDVYQETLKDLFSAKDKEVTTEEIHQTMTTRCQVLVDGLVSMGYSADEIKNNIYSSNPDNAVANYTSKILEERYPGYTFTNYPNAVREGQSKSYCLSILLNTHQGLEAINKYLSNGKVDEKDIRGLDQNGVSVINNFQSAMNFLGREFKRVLTAETSELHIRDFNAAKGTS